VLHSADGDGAGRLPGRPGMTTAPSIRPALATLALLAGCLYPAAHGRRRLRGAPGRGAGDVPPLASSRWPSTCARARTTPRRPAACRPGPDLRPPLGQDAPPLAGAEPVPRRGDRWPRAADRRGRAEAEEAPSRDRCARARPEEAPRGARPRAAPALLPSGAACQRSAACESDLCVRGVCVALAMIEIGKAVQTPPARVAVAPPAPRRAARRGRQHSPTSRSPRLRSSRRRPPRR
jgi:hypothetical protein